MPRHPSRRLHPPVLAALLAAIPIALLAVSAAHATSIGVSFPPSVESEAIDGRVIVILTPDDSEEPRFQVRAGLEAAQIFGVDVEDLRPDEVVPVDGIVPGYPIDSLNRMPPGPYYAQAVLHRYETFERADGHVVKLPMDRGEGQRWNRAPGNLVSEPTWIEVDLSQNLRVDLVLDREIPPIEPPADTEYVKHFQIRSERLSEFWGRDMFLGAHVLLPHGYDEHPDARYPLMIFHGHFPSDFGGFRPEPPDPDLECEYSERFDVDCYNRIEQEEAHAFYERWTSPDFPRFLAVEIQHANPYYDDSYAVNSANVGPYGDAITYELVPEIERRFRGLGEPWSRFLYGGSTGGWEALAAQVFYPTEYNGAFAACPDPVDFRAYVTVDIYEDRNAYYELSPFRRLPKPGHRDSLGHIQATIDDYCRMELVLGEKNRSGDQFDIWEAVYSPVGEDGYPRRLWDRRTGVFDREVAEHWREHYDLRHILERDWATLGPDLVGKIHVYVGDMDNYYLNNAVYLLEDFLESTEDPHYGGVVDYGDRAEHCWNGDHENGNHLSRLRYHTMYLDRTLERIEESAPEGADLTSWRY